MASPAKLRSIVIRGSVLGLGQGFYLNSLYEKCIVNYVCLSSLSTTLVVGRKSYRHYFTCSPQIQCNNFIMMDRKYLP